MIERYKVLRYRPRGVKARDNEGKISTDVEPIKRLVEIDQIVFLRLRRWYRKTEVNKSTLKIKIVSMAQRHLFSNEKFSKEFANKLSRMHIMMIDIPHFVKYRDYEEVISKIDLAHFQHRFTIPVKYDKGCFPVAADFLYRLSGYQSRSVKITEEFFATIEDALNFTGEISTNNYQQAIIIWLKEQLSEWLDIYRERVLVGKDAPAAGRVDPQLIKKVLLGDIPIILDVGSAGFPIAINVSEPKGERFLAMAKYYSGEEDLSALVVGIEPDLKRYRKAASRLIKRKINNAILVHSGLGNIEEIAFRFPGDLRFSKVVICAPTPTTAGNVDGTIARGMLEPQSGVLEHALKITKEELVIVTEKPTEINEEGNEYNWFELLKKSVEEQEANISLEIFKSLEELDKAYPEMQIHYSFLEMRRYFGYIDKEFRVVTVRKNSGLKEKSTDNTGFACFLLLTLGMINDNDKESDLSTTKRIVNFLSLIPGTNEFEEFRELSELYYPGMFISQYHEYNKKHPSIAILAAFWGKRAVGLVDIAYLKKGSIGVDYIFTRNDLKKGQLIYERY